MKSFDEAKEYFITNGQTSYKYSPSGFWSQFFWAGWATARAWDNVRVPFKLFTTGWEQYRDEWGMNK